MADTTSNSGSDRFPYDPRMIDKVLMADEHQLADLSRKSHRAWDKYMRSTPELKQKYDVK